MDLCVLVRYLCAGVCVIGSVLVYITKMYGTTNIKSNLIRNDLVRLAVEIRKFVSKSILSVLFLGSNAKLPNL
jgi:hypothetical protein